MKRHEIIKDKEWVKPKFVVLSLKKTNSGYSPGAGEGFTYDSQ